MSRDGFFDARAIARSAGIVAGLGYLALAGAASAQETTTYTYDALGRVKTVTHAGGPASGVSSTYSYDPASNRTNVTVNGAQTSANGDDPNSGASAPSRRPMVVVVPLNGFTVIPIN
jgi:YD repeat-containing protein